MADFDNTNRGVLFKNDRKEQQNHPDYKGSVNVNGHEFWLSAWIKDGQKGKFMSLSVQPKEQQAPKQDKAGAQKPQRQAQEDDFDSIPF